MASGVANNVDVIADFMRDQALISNARTRPTRHGSLRTHRGGGGLVDLEEAALQAAIKLSLQEQEKSKQCSGSPPGSANSASSSDSSTSSDVSTGQRSDFYNAALTASHMQRQYELTKQHLEPDPAPQPNMVRSSTTADRYSPVIPAPTQHDQVPQPNINMVRRSSTTARRNSPVIPAPTQPDQVPQPNINMVRRSSTTARRNSPGIPAAAQPVQQSFTGPNPAFGEPDLQPPIFSRQHNYTTQLNAARSRPSQLPDDAGIADSVSMLTAPPTPYNALHPIYNPQNPLQQYRFLAPAYDYDLGQQAQRYQLQSMTSTNSSSGRVMHRGVLPAAPVYAVPPPSTSGRQVDHGIPTAAAVNRRYNSSLGLMHSFGLTNTFGGSNNQIHSQAALNQLMTKAASFMCYCHMRETPFFYRDKTLKYFENILLKCQGLMQTYSKDFHGDPKSPINGRLDGLFFSVNIDPVTKLLPRSSIYGERRILIPPDRILSRFPNIYFTDFYCISKPHYVTLVLTHPGSTADAFCQQYLVQLSWDDNPFCEVRRNAAGELHFYVQHKHSDLWVEVMVTGDINLEDELSAGAEWDTVIMRGNRSGGRRGLRKKVNCRICNI